jgi:hypothetical protein
MYLAVNTRNTTAKTTKKAVAAMGNRLVDMGAIFLSVFSSCHPNKPGASFASLYSPECVEGQFSEVHTGLRDVASLTGMDGTN